MSKGCSEIQKVEIVVARIKEKNIQASMRTMGSYIQEFFRAPVFEVGWDRPRVSQGRSNIRGHRYHR